MAELVTFVEIDTPAFDDTTHPVGTQTWRFAEDVQYLPRHIEAIPSITGVSLNAAIISLGKDLGQRASLTVTFKDHRHVMNGEPFDQGTFWGKWRARYGQKLRGCPIRLIQGFAGQQLSDMDVRHFFVDATDGPTPDGVYTITAKDLLKFADHDRAQAPKLSNGRLATGIDDQVTSAVLTPEGIGDLEYPPNGYLCIGGKEIVSFTRAGDHLTIVRGQLGTPAMSHQTGDRVQLVLRYPGNDVADIIADLLTNYASIDPQFIPIDEWRSETSDHLGGIIYARAITEPTAVNKLLNELIEQAGLAVWWDERARIVRLQVIREIATDVQVFDEDVILEGSLRVKDQPDKRISQIWTYFQQRNPADRGDNHDNYRSALATVDLQREAEYGGPKIRKIMGNWIPTITAAERINQIQLSRFRDPPRHFAFDLFHGTPITPGGGYRLRWRQNQDRTGKIVEEGAPIQVTRVSVDKGVIHVEAEEMLASGSIIITKTIILTSAGNLNQFQVPDDWNSADNIIGCLGGGGGGAGSIRGGIIFGGKGGGGGAYSSVSNVTLTPGAMISYHIGSGGVGGNRPGNDSSDGTDGGSTWFGAETFTAAIVAAEGGSGGRGRYHGGTGGRASVGIGAVRFSGGDGGQGSGPSGGGGGGGGGAAGPHGNGGPGGVGGGSTGEMDGGAGGGGANGGGQGEPPNGDSGGRGGHNRFGFGGGTSTNPHGSDGGGGVGGSQDQSHPLGAGSAELIWTQTIAPIYSAGPAGGGGGGAIRNHGGHGALYGAGGGGGGGEAQTYGGNGAQGLIFLTWRPAN